MPVKLREIAHSRAGDKGDAVNLSLIPYDEDDYDLLVEKVTAPRVKEFFVDIVKGGVARYELPNIKSLNFVLTGLLEGGVTKSILIDPHGKCLSTLFLDMEIETGRR